MPKDEVNFEKSPQSTRDGLANVFTDADIWEIPTSHQGYQKMYLGNM